jgi:hypothetical protein
MRIARADIPVEIRRWSGSSHRRRDIGPGPGARLKRNNWICGQGLVIVMEQYSRQHVVDLLKRLGYTQLAQEAARVLPDPVGAEEAATWGMQHGLTHDALVSQMGGSP